MRGILMFGLIISSCTVHDTKNLKLAPTLRTPWCDQQEIIWPRKSFPIKWSFDCDFPGLYKSWVQDAAKYWNWHFGEDIFEEVGCEKGQVVVKDAAETSTTNLASVLYSYACGMPVSKWNWTINLYEEWFLLTSHTMKLDSIKHELGHVLGLAHSDNKECLMYPTVSPGKFFKHPCELEELTMKERYGF